MKTYKFLAGKAVAYTTDKILADFMNSKLSVWQRICLAFMR